MNIVRNAILGVVALAGFAVATPAQAHDHYRYHHYYHSGPRFGITFGSPYYYSYRPYYYSDGPYYNDYYYRRPYYGYSYGPGLSFAFGGHHHYYSHSSHHHHHHH